MNNSAITRLLKWQLTIGLNVLAPIGAYQIATGWGVAEMQALLMAALFPMANTAWGMIRSRRIDLIGAMSAAAIIVGATASLLLHDPRILLVKESLLTGAVGVACLGSLLTSHPLIALLASHFGMPREQLTVPDAQTAIRRMTAIWGLAFISEASARIVLSFLLEPGVLVTVSPVVAVAVFGPLGLWTVYQKRRSPRQLQPTAA